MLEFSKSKWIWSGQSRDRNAVVIFRRAFTLEKVVASALCRAACDTHYYLYVNGKPVIWEGGALRSEKRGYYDEFDIAKHLVKGNNVIVVYALYYGMEGTDYQAISPGFIFECEDLNIYSDASFTAYANKNAYKDVPPTDPCPYAGFSIVYDATLEGQISGILESTFSSSLFEPSLVVGDYGGAPFGKLRKRLTPNFTFSHPASGRRTKVDPRSVGIDPKYGDVYCVNLDGAKHFSPCFTVVAKGMDKIIVFTDCHTVKSEDNTRTYRNYRVEYSATSGVNNFEGYLDMYGSKIYFVMPSTVKVNFLGYRETSYGAPKPFLEPEDKHLALLIQKATNTLTDCMRSSFIDTPERDRAFRPLDASALSRAAFFAYDNARGIVRRAITDVLDSSGGNTVYANIPGNPEEIPYEGLAACSEFGLLWNYYNRTGDGDFAVKFVELIYNYLMKWQCADNHVQTSFFVPPTVKEEEDEEENTPKDQTEKDDTPETAEENHGEEAAEEKTEPATDTADTAAPHAGPSFNEQKTSEGFHDSFFGHEEEEKKEPEKQEELPVFNEQKVSEKFNDSFSDSHSEYRHLAHIKKESKLASPIFEKIENIGAYGIIARSHKTDFGYNADVTLIENALYYSACKVLKALAADMGIEGLEEIDMRMRSIEKLFEECYNGGYVCSGCYDDRTNALAVITGLCDESKFPEVKSVLESVYCSSPRYEWAVTEALIKMNAPKTALNRLLTRYKPCLERDCSTLPETFTGKIACRGYEAGLIPALMSATATIGRGGKHVTVTPNVKMFGSYTAHIYQNGTVILKVKKFGERVDVFVENNSTSDVYLKINPALLPVQTEAKTVKLNRGKTKIVL